MSNYWERAYAGARHAGLCLANDYEPGTTQQPEWCWRKAVAPSDYCWQHSGKAERDAIRATKESE